MGFRGMRFVVHVVLREIFGGKMEKYFNNSTFYNVVCIGWTVKCLKLQN